MIFMIVDSESCAIPTKRSAKNFWESYLDNTPKNNAKNGVLEYMKAAKQYSENYKNSPTKVRWEYNYETDNVGLNQ